MPRAEEKHDGEGLPCAGEKHDDEGLPCFHCHPQRYIKMVQHLIEKCLVLRMSRNDTVEALARRAGIRPLVTLTVWKELLKENRSFFHEYFREIAFKPPVYKTHSRPPCFSSRRQLPCTPAMVEESQRREQHRRLALPP